MTVTPGSYSPDYAAVSNMLTSLMDAIVETYATNSVSLPTRQVVTAGGIAYDGELVAVSFLEMYLGMPGSQAQALQPINAPRTVVIQVHVVRCVPTRAPRGTSAPDASTVTESTIARMADVWLLTESVAFMMKDQYGTGVLVDTTVTDPQGDLQGVVATVTMPVW